MQKDYSKVTAYLIELLARLPDVLQNKPNVNDIESKTEIVQIIFDGLKLAGHGNQSMDKLREKYLLSGVSGEYKDLQKFGPESDWHLLGYELEDSFKKAKGRHYSLQALKKTAGDSQVQKRKANDDMPSSKSKNHRPAEKIWTSQKGSPLTNKQRLAPKHDSHIRKDHRGHRN